MGLERLSAGTRYLNEIVAQIQSVIAAEPKRSVLGFAGLPGSGKSTLVGVVTRRLEEVGVKTGYVPMDGFHLANGELMRLGLRDRKGAIETFDGWGYLSLLRRLRQERGSVIYAPAYERRLEEAVAGCIGIPPAVDCVLTEGNYLLVDEPPWREVGSELSAAWFLTLPDDLRRERLLARHIQGGKSADAAREWIRFVDDVNAARVAATRPRATFEIDMARLDGIASNVHGTKDTVRT